MGQSRIRGAELRLGADSETGSYRPVWINLDSIDELDVRPRSLFRALRDKGIDALADEPVEVSD